MEESVLNADELGHVPIPLPAISGKHSNGIEMG
jgi:hypothetical protein